MEENKEKQVEISQVEKIKTVIEEIKNKKSKFLFFIPTTTNPAASIYEIYFHATTIKNMGYDVKMLTDTTTYEIPDWIEKTLTDINHESMEQAKLTVSPQDVLVIPEIFSNVMEQTKNLPALRIGLLQSIDYKINALMPGVDWKSFGIENIITTSETLKEVIEEFYGKNYNIKHYDVGIPTYFNGSNEIKRPVISIVGRNSNEVAKVIKLFYAKYPQYSWVTFDSMVTDSKPPQPMRRVDYAARLKKNFAGVWIDRITSFGTFPLECMAAETIPIGLVPDLTPEYLLNEEGKPKENIGVWTRDIYVLPILIGDLITKFLDDSIGEEVKVNMKEVVLKYSQENSTKQLQKIYQDLLNNRIDVLEKAIEINENKEKITEKQKQQ